MAGRETEPMTTEELLIQKKSGYMMASPAAVQVCGRFLSSVPARP